MKYNKTYLLIQSLRSQNLSNKRISELSGLTPSTVSKLLNNKQKSVNPSTEKKLLHNLKTKSYYNKTSKSHSNNYSDTVLIKTAGFLSLQFAQKNNMYNIMRASKKLSKSQDVLKDIRKGYKKFQAENEGEVLQFMTSDILKEGLIAIRG